MEPNKSASFYLIAFTIILGIGNALEILAPHSIRGIYYHIPSHFGPSMQYFEDQNIYKMVLSEPDLYGCTAISENALLGHVVLILRGTSRINSSVSETCRFVTKVYYAQMAGATAVVIGNNVGEHDIVPMFAASDDNKEDILIPAISVSHSTYTILADEINAGVDVQVRINNKGSISDNYDSSIERWITVILSTLFMLASISLLVVGALSFGIFKNKLIKLLEKRNRRRRINSIPIITYHSSKCNHNQKNIRIESIDNDVDELISNEINDNETSISLMEIPLMENKNENATPLLHNDICNICLEDFVDGENIKLLQCSHGFHEKCIESWIISKGTCPVCIQSVFHD